MDESLLKFVVLVPCCHNDGTKVSNELILDFEENVFVLGGGITLAGTVQGAYRMADGKKQIDHSFQYWIGIPAGKIEELRKVVSELGHVLGQESMYFEHTGSKIELLPPASKGGKKK